MAETGEVLAALARALAALEEARKATEQAGARVQQVQEQVTRTGFRAIAAGLVPVNERLKRAEVIQSALATNTKVMLGTVHTVSAAANPERVVSTLTTVLEQLRQVSGGAATVVREVDAAKADTASALRGGRPGPMLAVLNEINLHHAHVVSWLADARRRTEETIDEACGLGVLAGVSASGTPPFPVPHLADTAVPSNGGAAHRIQARAAALWSSTKTRSAVEHAYGHYKKHGVEFSDVQNSLQYVCKAMDWFDDPPSNIMTKTRGNGDVVRFDPDTGYFGVMKSDGTPRTFFVPDAAKHGYETNLDYFDAQ
jgi:hypothetical protein